MDSRIILGVSLIAIPVLFNVIFGILAKNFDYPNVLRYPTAEVLGKFSAGGSKLILTWWSFMLTAVAFVPLAIAIPSVLDSQNQTLNSLIVGFGLTAGMVQFIGLSRWVFLVPYLARESQKQDIAKTPMIELIFQSSNRFLGVAIGEHLGYLFTGLWSISTAFIFLGETNSHPNLGLPGIAIGILLIICSLEFVGKNEEMGWKVAATITPFVYIAWSLWLISLGVMLLANVI